MQKRLETKASSNTKSSTGPIVEGFSQATLRFRPKPTSIAYFQQKFFCHRWSPGWFQGVQRILGSRGLEGSGPLPTVRGRVEAFSLGFRVEGGLGFRARTTPAHAHGLRVCEVFEAHPVDRMCGNSAFGEDEEFGFRVYCCLPSAGCAAKSPPLKLIATIRNPTSQASNPSANRLILSPPFSFIPLILLFYSA